MFDSVLVAAFLVGAVHIFVSDTDYKQIVTRWYGTKRRGSLGIMSISGSVKQMRVGSSFWEFLPAFSFSLGYLLHLTESKAWHSYRWAELHNLRQRLF